MFLWEWIDTLVNAFCLDFDRQWRGRNLVCGFMDVSIAFYLIWGHSLGSWMLIYSFLCTLGTFLGYWIVVSFGVSRTIIFLHHGFCTSMFKVFT